MARKSYGNHDHAAIVAKDPEKRTWDENLKVCTPNETAQLAIKCIADHLVYFDQIKPPSSSSLSFGAEIIKDCMAGAFNRGCFTRDQELASAFQAGWRACEKFGHDRIIEPGGAPPNGNRE
jgi:hypothetical protein